MFAAQRTQTEVIELLLPYEQGMEDSEGHTAKWYANNSDLGVDLTRVRELLENEGSERLPPPLNSVEMPKLSTEIESLRKELVNQRARILALEEEVVQLKNLVEAGNRLVTGSNDQDS